jgi:hypothetical protein
MNKISLIGSVFIFSALILIIQAADRKIPCNYSCQDCFPYGCIPETTNQNRDIVKSKQSSGDTTIKTYCGKCFEDADCGGAKCENGLCSKYVSPVPPRPIWPSFQLITTEIAFANCTTAYFKHPIISAGYLFEGAFRKVVPLKRVDGSFVAVDLPKFYWHAGGAFAFSGSSQNIFGEIGITYYYPVILFSSYSLLGEYQRTGSALWNSPSLNRVGPVLSLSIMQNIYLKGGYLLSVDNNGKSTAYGSIAYMKDLLGDLAPDRYKKYLPKELSK